jgi:hypothetical protein
MSLVMKVEQRYIFNFVVREGGKRVEIIDRLNILWPGCPSANASVLHGEGGEIGERIF